MKPASILIVASYSPSIVSFRGDLISALVDQGCKVHVAAPGLLEDTATRCALTGLGCLVYDVPMVRAGISPFHDLRTILSIYRLVKNTGVESVLCYTVKPVVYGMLASYLARVKYRYALITGLGFSFSRGGSFRVRMVRSVARALYRFGLRFSTRVFFQNEDDAFLFRNDGIVSSSVPVQVVNGSGINLEAFSPAPRPPSPHFLFIARLIGAKGIREYAEAAIKVLRRYPDAKFEIVGWFDDNPDSIGPEELDGWVKQGILFSGRLDDVRPAIARCSVYVLPSYREGTPRTVLEAMAMGRAIITTNTPGCRQTVEDGVNGILVPVQAVTELVDAMRFMIENPDRCDDMGRKSRLLAEAKYDVNKVNRDMLSGMGLND